MTEFNQALAELEDTKNDEHKRQLELSWAAGFFDGEGSIMISRRTDRYQSFPPADLRLVLSITQSVDNNKGDIPYTLKRFINSIKVGTINPMPKGKDNWKKRYIWKCVYQDALKTIYNIAPYLADKKFEEMVERVSLTSYPLNCEELYKIRKILTPNQSLAWCAGFWDAEGSCSLRKKQNTIRGVRAGIGQSSNPNGSYPQVFDRLMLTLNYVGKIYNISNQHNLRRGLKAKPAHSYVIEKYEEVKCLYLKLKNFLSPVKIEQFEMVLTKFKNYKLKG